jgi:hypothetical protein
MNKPKKCEGGVVMKNVLLALGVWVLFSCFSGFSYANFDEGLISNNIIVASGDVAEIQKATSEVKIAKTLITTEGLNIPIKVIFESETQYKKFLSLQKPIDINKMITLAFRVDQSQEFVTFKEGNVAKLIQNKSFNTICGGVIARGFLYFDKENRIVIDFYSPLAGNNLLSLPADCPAKPPCDTEAGCKTSDGKKGICVSFETCVCDCPPPGVPDGACPANDQVGFCSGHGCGCSGSMVSCKKKDLTCGCIEDPFDPLSK